MEKKQSVFERMLLASKLKYKFDKICIFCHKNRINGLKKNTTKNNKRNR
jgi:hypothetical protein